MPMYQYTCRTCGGDFEKKLPMSRASESQACPCCDSQDTRKRIGAIAFTGGATASMAAARPVSSPFT